MEGAAAAARLLADPASDALLWRGGAERRAGAWGGGAADGLGWDGRRRRGRFALAVGDQEKCLTNASTVCNAKRDMHVVFCLLLLELVLGGQFSSTSKSRCLDMQVIVFG